MTLKSSLLSHVFLVDKSTNQDAEIGIYSTSIFQKKSLIIQQQEKYISKLARLRKSLQDEEEKSNKMWQEMSQAFPRPRMNRDKQLEANPEEPSRKAHLERLRRIRILQKRRKAPPLLTPIHGVQIFATEKQKVLAHTQYKPLENREWSQSHRITKAVLHTNNNNKKTWTHQKITNKQDLYGDCLQNEMDFPSDIRELLRRTKHSDPPVSSQSDNSMKLLTQQQRNYKHHKTSVANKISLSSCNTAAKQKLISDVHEDQGTLKHITNTASIVHESITKTPPLKRSSSLKTPQKHMSKTDSLSKTRMARSGHKLEYISSQIVGYRLPPLYRSMPTTPMEIATSSTYLTPAIGSPKRHIIVKIPHDVKCNS